MLRGVFATRGCKEELIPDPELLADGKVMHNARDTESTSM